MKPLIVIAALSLAACESVSKAHDPETGLTFTTFRDVSAIHAQSIGQTFHDKNGKLVWAGGSTEKAVLPEFVSNVVGAGLIGWGLSGIETTVAAPEIKLPGGP